MNFLDRTIAPLGLGCWPIGGPMFSGEQSLGYTNTDDDMSLKTIHAALDGGITVFDTAAAYGAGHSERLLAQALKGRDDALIITKIGFGIDEATKQIDFGPFHPEDVAPAIEGCLRRLERDRIDLLLLHVNDMPVEKAEAVFDAFERARAEGKVRAFGWSTDFSESAAAMIDRKGFVAIEHAMNVFADVPRIQSVARDNGLVAFQRSPLAMGLLSGKYDTTTKMPQDDVRASRQEWMEYFKNGAANPELLASLNGVRELLMSDGRTLVQGALGWIWAKGDHNVPVPGARTPEQVTGLAGALAHGPLPEEGVAEIDGLIERVDEPDRQR